MTFTIEIYKCWFSICGAHPDALTISAVRRLEGRYPQLSTNDALYITERFHDLDVFETIQDEKKRDEMLSAVLRYPGWILSLRLLIQDTRILEPAAKIMKCLFPAGYGERVQASMEACFQNPGVNFSEANEESSRSKAAYRGLWLRAWK